MSPPLVTREAVDALERDLADRNAELSRLERALEAARDQRAKLVDLVGDGVAFVPLPVGPLAGAIAANILALTSLWFSYIAAAFLEGWTFVPSVAALVLAVPFDILASRTGAGGSARALLRRATILVAAVSLLALVAGNVRLVASIVF